jgi:uncharacterized protein (UPF0147 family)
MSFVSNLIIEAVANAAWDIIKVNAPRLHDIKYSKHEAEALHRVYEYALITVETSSASALDRDSRMHLLSLLSFCLNDSALAAQLLCLALTKRSLSMADIPIADLRLSFEAAGMDTETLAISFNSLAQDLEQGMVQGLKREEEILQRLVEFVLIDTTPARITEHQARMSQENKSKALQNYLIAVCSYCKQLPYSLPVEHLPSLLDIYVDQRLEKECTDASYDNKRRDGAEEQSPDITIEQALEYDPNILLQAGPGQGKTSLLRQLAISLSNNFLETGGGNRLLVPVPITARGLAARAGSLSAILHAQITEEMGTYWDTPLPPDFFEAPPSTNGAWLVLVDGLDEIVGQKNRERLVNIISEHAKRRPSSYRFVVASRPLNTVFPKDSTFARYTLSELKPEQPAIFAQRWFKHQPGSHPDDPELFLKQVEESRLENLVRIPLLLTMAAVVYQQDRKRPLPAHRAGLYARFLTVMLEVEEAERGTLYSYSNEWQKLYGQSGKKYAERLFVRRRLLLEHLALWRHMGGTGPLVNEAVKFARSKVVHTRDVDGDWLRLQMEALLQRTGVISRRDGEWEFIHHTFLEFLAASALAKQYNPDSVNSVNIVSQWRHEEWREIVVFLLAIWSELGLEVTELLQQLWRSKGFIFAAYVLAEGVTVNAEVDHGIIESVLRHTRRLKDPEHFPYIREYAALDAIGRLYDREDVRVALIEIVWNDSEGRLVTHSVIETLCRLRYFNDVRALGHDRTVNGFLRLHCGYTLAQSGRVDDAASILTTLVNDREIMVGSKRASLRDRARFFAGRQLCELGCDDVASKALQSLAIETSCNVTRDEILETLYWFNRHEELVELARDPEMADYGRVKSYTSDDDIALMLIRRKDIHAARSLLLGIICNKHAELSRRTNAVCWLGDTSLDDNAVNILLLIMKDEGEDRLLRVHIAEQLVQHGMAEEASPVLLRAGRDISLDDRARLIIIETLGKIGYTEDAKRILLDMTKGKCAISLEVISSMERFGLAEELQALAENQSINYGDRLRAAKAASSLGQAASAVSALAAMVLEPAVTYDIRSQAIKQLHKLDAADELILLANNESLHPAHRVHAAAAAGETVKAEGSVPILLELAQDLSVDRDIRRSAAHTLRRMGCAEAKTILRFLRDDAAAEGLAIARDPDASPEERNEAVRGLLENKRKGELLNIVNDFKVIPSVRLTAARCLRSFNPEVNPAPHFFNIACDETIPENDWHIRSTAIEYLKRLCWDAEEAPHKKSGHNELSTIARDESLSTWIRYDAADALLQARYRDDAIPVLLSIAFDEHADSVYRGLAVSNILRSGVVSALLSLLRKHDLDIQKRLDCIVQLKHEATECDLEELSDILSELNLMANGEPDGRIRAAAHDSVPAIRKLLHKRTLCFASLLQGSITER